MSKSDAWEGDLLKLVFQNINSSLIGDATGLRGSVSAGNLYVSLHTADPGETGDQTTNETVYTGYARVAVVRSAAGFTVSGNAPTSVSPASNVDFPVCTGGTASITYFGVGTSPTGAGKLLYSGTVSPTIAVSTGVIPRLTTATAITED